MTEHEWLVNEDPIRLLSKVIRNGTLRRESEPGGREDWASLRMLRLFCVACCRRVFHIFTDERSRKAIEVAERFSDGKATDEELNGTWSISVNVGVGAITFAAARCADSDDYIKLAPAIVCNSLDEWLPRPAKANILRDIIGNPWHPVKLPDKKCWDCQGYGCHLGSGPDRGNPKCSTCKGTGRLVACTWITSTVRNLAEVAYQERAENGSLESDQLMILADALEEGGCTDERILWHLRGQEERISTVQPGETYWIPKRGPCVRGCHIIDLLTGRE